VLFEKEREGRRTRLTAGGGRGRGHEACVALVCAAEEGHGALHIRAHVPASQVQHAQVIRSLSCDRQSTKRERERGESERQREMQGPSVVGSATARAQTCAITHRDRQRQTCAGPIRHGVRTHIHRASVCLCLSLCVCVSVLLFLPSVRACVAHQSRRCRRAPTT
jgi:hypothetical protein